MLNSIRLNEYNVETKNHAMLLNEQSMTMNLFHNVTWVCIKIHYVKDHVTKHVMVLEKSIQ